MPRGTRVTSESAALVSGGSTSDRVNCGIAASILDLNPFTYVFWLMPTTLAASRRVQQLGLSPSGRHGMQLTDTSGNVNCFVGRATANTSYTTSSTPLAPVDSWRLIGYDFDSTLAPAMRVMAGSLTSPAAEATYASAADGSGTVTAQSGAQNLYLLNFESLNQAFQGRIAAAALFARRLTLAEYRLWQYSAFDDPFPAVMTGCRGLWYPGNDGVTKAIDYSGFHNDGAVTGLTLGRGVALPTLDQWAQVRPRYFAPTAAAVSGFGRLLAGERNRMVRAA